MTAVPDPLAFAIDALASRGALVEPGDGEAMALLPAGLADGLHVGEELRLVDGAAAPPACVPCGMGTPLLEQLIAYERSRVPIAAARLDHDRPREAQARAAGERFTIRNGLSDVCEVVVGEAVYVAAAIAYVAEADDRQEGLLSFSIEATSGGTPDEHFTAWLDPSRVPSRLVPLRAQPAAHAGAADLVARRAAHLAGMATLSVADSVLRRKRREHARICEYFAALIAETRGASSRGRRADPAAIATKVAHFIAERDAKLRDLDARFRLRVTLTPAALLLVVVPAAAVRLRLRRRKAERELVLRLPSGARALDAPPCDGCSGEAARPALCDERLHLLCERCAPGAEGRPHCPACRGSRSAPRA